MPTVNSFSEFKKQYLPLTGKVTVYVPATVNVNQEIDNTAYVNHVARVLSTLFGGATSTPAAGFYVANNGKLVTEKTTLVFAYCDDKALNANIAAVLELCNELKAEMSQECVALEINGRMAFV